MRSNVESFEHSAEHAPVDAISLDEPMLDAQQTARLLNVRVSWITEATRTGLLPCLKVGRQVRWLRPMLERCFNERRAP